MLKKYITCAFLGSRQRTGKTNERNRKNVTPAHSQARAKE